MQRCERETNNFTNPRYTRTAYPVWRKWTRISSIHKSAWMNKKKNKKRGSNCLRSDYSVWTHSVAGGEYSWSGSWGADSTRRSKSLVRVLLGCKECVIGLSLFAWARVSAGEYVCVFCVPTLTGLNKGGHHTGTVFWWKHTTHTKGRAFLDKKTKQNWRLDI